MPSYQLRFAQNAIDTIHSLQSEDQQRVEKVLESVAQTEQITSHEKCNSLKDDLCKVRVGNYRAVVRLSKPVLEVLEFDKRNKVYQNSEYL